MPQLEPEYLLRVFLVFVRIGAMLSAAPFFSQRAFPVRVRVLFSVLLAYALVGMATGPLPPYATTTLGLAVSVGVEAMTGVMLGFAGQFVFWAIQFAGELLGFQMGLTMSQVFDPLNGTTNNPAGQFLSMTFLMGFLLIDGHHHVLQALVNSFGIVPLGGAHLASGGPLFLDWTGNFLLTGLRLSAPFLVTFFLIETALGVMARFVPQADIFSIDIPLKLLVGTGLLLLFMQQFFPIIPGMVAGMLDDLMHLMQALAS